MRDELQSRGALENTRRGLEQNLEAVDAEIANLTSAIAMGTRTLLALVQRLEMADAKRQALAGELARLELGENPVRIDWRAVERQARQTLADWRGSSWV